MLVSIGVESGALRKCYIHGHCVIREWDEEGERRFYAMATNAWKEGEIGGSREEVMEAVHHLIQTTPDHCTHCAHDMAKD